MPCDRRAARLHPRVGGDADGEVEQAARGAAVTASLSMESVRIGIHLVDFNVNPDAPADAGGSSKEYACP